MSTYYMYIAFIFKRLYFRPLMKTKPKFFTGDNKFIVFDYLVPAKLCDPTPCKNGGTCQLSNPSKEMGYSCTCRPGYIGFQCQWGKSHMHYEQPSQCIMISLISWISSFSNCFIFITSVFASPSQKFRLGGTGIGRNYKLWWSLLMFQWNSVV